MTPFNPPKPPKPPAPLTAPWTLKVVKPFKLLKNGSTVSRT
jgi:hypothetical protein